MIWFMQAQKACMYGSCMYSKVKKIQKWGKSGSDELYTNKRPQINVHVGTVKFYSIRVEMGTLEKVQISVSQGPRVPMAGSTLLSATSFKIENVA